MIRCRGYPVEELYKSIAALIDQGTNPNQAIATGVDLFIETQGRYLPGFGHRFHPVDTRAEIDGGGARRRQQVHHQRTYAGITEGIDWLLSERKPRPIPMNMGGAKAVIYPGLGFPASLARSGAGGARGPCS